MLKHDIIELNARINDHRFLRDNGAESVDDYIRAKGRLRMKIRKIRRMLEDHKHKMMRAILFGRK